MLVFVVLFLLAFNVGAVQAQEKKPFKLKEIIAKLKGNSGAANRQTIVKEICERGTDEELDAKNEKLLREAGANDAVIKTIRERFEIQKERERLYMAYVNNYDKNIEKRKIALKAGKDYLEKFENSKCNTDDPLIPYFKENLPIIERTIREIEDRRPDIDDFPCKCISDYQHHVENFNYAIKRKDWKTAFSTGEEILKLKPEFLDLALILAAVGYDRAVELKEKSEFNEKTISYAELAIKLIDKGEKSDNYGANFDKDRKQDYIYKTKPNALGWMNYIVGYVKYFGQNKKTEAVTYFYKAANYKSEVQNFPELYRAVGDWYFEQSAETADVKGSRDITVKNLLELALDAYARAYNLSKNDAKRESSEKILITYALRHSRQPNAAEIEKITTAVKQKPLPEPF